MLWGGDPLFYNLIGTDSAGGFGEVKINGWHGEFMSDDEVFADGSARTIRAVAKDDPSYAFSPTDLDRMGVMQQARNLTTRGPDWKLDCYPDPGASFGNYFPYGNDFSGWPKRNAYRYALPRRLQ